MTREEQDAILGPGYPHRVQATVPNLRDQFAMAALAGVAHGLSEFAEEANQQARASMARQAYAIADAMLAERAK